MNILSKGVTAAAFAAVAVSAHAGVIGLTLVDGDDGGQPFNTVAFGVTNLSDPGVSLTGLSLTIGDTQYLFDEIYLSREQFIGGDGTQAATLDLGDRVQDGAGTDLFQYSFTNFAPGVTFRGQWDIDNDNGTFDVDSRTVLFNNGAAPNAVLGLTFSDGSAASYTFPDLPIEDSYSLTIPGPASLVLATAGGLYAKPRRKRAQA